jgi:hypothetical protein
MLAIERGDLARAVEQLVDNFAFTDEAWVGDLLNALDTCVLCLAISGCEVRDLEERVVSVRRSTGLAQDPRDLDAYERVLARPRESEVRNREALNKLNALANESICRLIAQRTLQAAPCGNI